jgi:putative endonuclease
MAGGFVYFMTNQRNGVLYTGVTSNLPQRAFQHRDGSIGGFTKRYRDAIQREKVVKHWPRRRKVQLLEATNPEWKDLYDTLV